jgi:homoserine O-acetyltransferase
MMTSSPVLHTIPATQLADWWHSVEEDYYERWKTHRLVSPIRVKFDMPLHLESGECLSQFEIQVELYGRLNTAKDNALLVCHALTGDAHLAGKHLPTDRKSGWWDDLVGSEKAFNPETHCIVCTHVLGGCHGSTGADAINPETQEPYGTTFPSITIADMVNAQYAVMQALDVPKWSAVVGGSMGGFQALEWGIRFPNAVEKLVVIASGTSYSTQGIAFNAVGRHAIMHDPDWQAGRYHESQRQPKKGLATARMLAHITYVSEDSLDLKFGRALIENQANPHLPNAHEPFQPAFEVESYLDYQGQQFVNRFDANSYLYLSKALDTFDVAHDWGNGDLEKALAPLQAKTLLVAYSSDWLFPPKESRRLVDTLLKQGKSCAYIEASSPLGHDAFLIETDALNQMLAPFLQSQEASSNSSSTALREDLELVLKLIEASDSVLDLGCGQGDLLLALRQRQGHTRQLGIEQRESAVQDALSKGMPVIQGDMLPLLKQMPAQSYDVAVLHLALQSMEDPVAVLQEMKRVAKRCIIGFPNFGFLPIRLQLLLKGRMPNSNALPYMWYNTPNIHLFTLKDFTSLSDEIGFKQARRIYRLNDAWQLRTHTAWGVNWRASHAIYELLPV